MTSIGWAPWASGAVLVLGLLLLVAGLRVLQRSGLSPEATRKLFHLGCGAAALSLPWLFESVWPLLVLSAVIGTLFLLLRLVPGLRAGPGQVLQAVSRESKGEFWFMLGVLTIFVVARASVVVYSIGILVLALADTAAALVGAFYGRHTFKVPGGSKSLEGSAALFLTALFCVHVPLLLFTDTGRLETLLVALNVSLVLTLAEADTALGSDNFVLPVLVVVLLKMLLEIDVTELALQSGVFLALVVFGFLYQERTTLSADALITAGLAGYVIWVFGGWQWLLVPVVMFSTYTWLVGRPRLESSRPFHAGVLIAIVSPGVALATAHAVLGLEVLYPPFVAVWGANMAVIGTLHGWLNDPEVAPLRLSLVNGAKSLVVLMPGILAAGSHDSWAIAGTVLGVAASLVLFYQFGEPLRREPTRSGAWGRLTLSVTGGTFAAFALVALAEQALAERFL